MTNERTRAFIETFFGRDALDLFRVATGIAGFDYDELWHDIRDHARMPIRRITIGQVENAMGRVSKRYEHLPEPTDAELDAMAAAIAAAAKGKAS